MKFITEWYHSYFPKKKRITIEAWLAEETDRDWIYERLSGCLGVSYEGLISLIFSTPEDASSFLLAHLETQLNASLDKNATKEEKQAFLQTYLLRWLTSSYEVMLELSKEDREAFKLAWVDLINAMPYHLHPMLEQMNQALSYSLEKKLEGLKKACTDDIVFSDQYGDHLYNFNIIQAKNEIAALKKRKKCARDIKDAFELANPAYFPTLTQCFWATVQAANEVFDTLNWSGDLEKIKTQIVEKKETVEFSQFLAVMNLNTLKAVMAGAKNVLSGLDKQQATLSLLFITHFLVQRSNAKMVKPEIDSETLDRLQRICERELPSYLCDASLDQYSLSNSVDFLTANLVNFQLLGEVCKLVTAYSQDCEPFMLGMADFHKGALDSVVTRV